MSWSLLLVSSAEFPLDGYEQRKDVVRVYFKRNTTSLPPKAKHHQPTLLYDLLIFLCSFEIYVPTWIFLQYF